MATASTESASSLLSETEDVGIIYPPADIRSIVEKTAQFVAKNGPQFEQRVLREQSNARFGFLLPDNPYRKFYEMKVQEYKTGNVEESTPKVPKAIQDMRQKEEEKKRKKEQQMLMLTEFGDQDELKPPPPDVFAVRHPYIAPVDMDVLKLTAQFVARNGQKFLIGLTQRERNNPQFDFLKPSHSLFNYFTNMVDCYSKCLLPDKEVVQQLKNNVHGDTPVEGDCGPRKKPFHRTLDKIYQRYRWEDQQKKKREEEEQKREEERAQLAAIDWHDFAVVETIDFTPEDDNVPLQAPVDLQNRHIEMMTRPLAERPGEVGKVAPVEVVEKMGDSGPPPAAAAEMLPKAGTVGQPAAVPLEMPRTQIEMANMGDQAEEKIIVKKNYVRKSVKRSFGDRVVNGQLMQLCPVTKQVIPASEMSKHLKILLLDPQWKEQKEKLMEKATKESAFAAGADVEGNLANFVLRRPDLFGTVDDEVMEHSETDAIDGSLASDAKRQRF